VTTARSKARSRRPISTRRSPADRELVGTTTTTTTDDQGQFVPTTTAGVNARADFAGFKSEIDR
jgi:hypothetical protein